MSKSKTVMLTLRIPGSLRTALRSSAKSEHRSVNSLVVAMLWKNFEGGSVEQPRRA